MKKGQASSEYLTTYIYAGVALVVIVGALGYFGAFNPSSYTKEGCESGQQLSCADALITADGTVQVMITNRLDRDITITNYTIIYNDIPYKNTDTTIVEPNKNFTLIARTGLIFKENKKEKVNYKLNYRPEGSSLDLTVSGTATEEVQKELTQECGNGIVEGTETCDYASENNACGPGNSCNTDCTCSSSCSGGYITTSSEFVDQGIVIDESITACCTSGSDCVDTNGNCQPYGAKIDTDNDGIKDYQCNAGTWIHHCGNGVIDTWANEDCDTPGTMTAMNCHDYFINEQEYYHIANEIKCSSECRYDTSLCQFDCKTEYQLPGDVIECCTPENGGHLITSYNELTPASPIGEACCDASTDCAYATECDNMGVIREINSQPHQCMNNNWTYMGGTCIPTDSMFDDASIDLGLNNADSYNDCCPNDYSCTYDGQCYNDGDPKIIDGDSVNKIVCDAYSALNSEWQLYCDSLVDCPINYDCDLGINRCFASDTVTCKFTVVDQAVIDAGVTLYGTDDDCCQADQCRRNYDCFSGTINPSGVLITCDTSGPENVWKLDCSATTCPDGYTCNAMHICE